MAPRRRTRLTAPVDLWVVVKLIIPNHIKERPVIHLAEGHPERIFRRVADTHIALLQGSTLRGEIAGEDKLLSKGIVLHVAAEYARSLGVSGAASNRLRIELAHKP